MSGLKKSTVFGIIISAVLIFSACSGGGGGSSSDSTPTYDKSIISFDFEAAYNTGILSYDSTGVISGTAISVTVPYGTDLTRLVATYVTAGAWVTVGGVEQASGETPNDFTNPVTYTVNAPDGTTQNYTVTVTVASASSKDITSFVFLKDMNIGLAGDNDVEGVISGETITVEVPAGTDITLLTPTIAITGASVIPISGEPIDFSDDVIYTVTAADASIKLYTVTVIIAGS